MERRKDRSNVKYEMQIMKNSIAFLSCTWMMVDKDACNVLQAMWFHSKVVNLQFRNCCRSAVVYKYAFHDKVYTNLSLIKYYK